jgi:uncharacterized protein (TIGR02145 family)
MPDSNRRMAENLNYKTNNSRCYTGDVICADGPWRLYARSNAKVACPAWWHLPSTDEWATLLNKIESIYGGIQDHGWVALAAGDPIFYGQFAWAHLKSSQEVGGIDSYGFSILLVGRRWPPPDAGVDYGGWFYRTTQQQSPGYWVSRTFDANIAKVASYYFGVGIWLSVRCVKD